jgi:LmbE family N-acetylglucosaminyl deacetylase
MTGLLVVVAHPDDEVLIAGGTLAACAAGGIPTGVVCLTRGEQGPIADPRLATRQTLAEVRLRELRASCAELGVSWLRCFRRQDGNLMWSNASEITRQLKRILNARRPDAVISFGEDGLYYHPDHIATYRFTRRAVALAATPPELYRAIWPSNLMPDLVRELADRGLPADLWNIEPDEFGIEGEDRRGEFEVDVDRFTSRKLRALRCHGTQFGVEHAFAALPDELVARFFGTERFARVDSDATGGWLADAVRACTAHA